MNRLVIVSTALGMLMTGAASANSTVLPVNGMCPNGYELQRTAGSDDQCIASVSAGSGPITLAALTSGGDDDHGSADHESQENETGETDSD